MRKCRFQEQEVKVDNKEPDIESLPPVEFKGRINYVQDFNDCASLCQQLMYVTTTHVVPTSMILKMGMNVADER